MTPAEQLRMLLDLATEIRDSGITHLKLGDLEATFAPAQPPAPSISTGKADDDDGETSSLGDALTFGRKPGSRLPGFDPPDGFRRGDDE